MQNNSYIVDPPDDMTISRPFNVVDVFEYYPLDELSYPEPNLRSSSLQVKGTDVEWTAQTFLE